MLYLPSTNITHPLPGLSTLQRWAANINLRNGLLEDILRIMDTAGKAKNKIKRITVLSFDEMKVTRTYEYDQKEDYIVGPYSYMQVVMARSLFDTWKQPVYVGFDQKITKALLETIIIRLHEINYEVIACVSDCGGGNQGLWKEMNINIHNPFSEHPVTRHRIHFFADTPHLLKLLRNWFLDGGFILSDGTSISQEPVKKLLESTNTEINACHRLTLLHLNCEKTQRQNVRLAAELFSNTVATALQHYQPGENKKLAKDVGTFFKLINTWFDIMNSYTPSARIPTKKPYGSSFVIQNDVLHEIIDTIGSMQCVGKRSMQTFQKGILISTKSIQNLFQDVKEDLDIQYILTHRLNQDCLENFFSQIRTRGGLHDHPSPLNALYRIRMIILGKNPGMVQSHTNVETPAEAEKEEYVLAGALKQAKIMNVKVSQPSKIIEDADSKTSYDSAMLSASNETETEKDGLIYLAGYLAKKYLKNYPSLGKYTYQTNEALNLHNYNMPSWVQSLSFGGLIQPSEEWMGEVQIMENHFQTLHQDQFSSPHLIIQETSTYILNKVNTPSILVRAFCRQRVFIRIKFLTMQMANANLGKRSYGRKTSKKVKKFCK